MKLKKIFLIVGNGGIAYIKKHKKFFKKEYGIIFYALLDKKQKRKIDLAEYQEVYDQVLFTDFSDSKQIFKTILPFKKEVVGLNAFGDAGIKYLVKTVGFFPELNLPTEASLRRANSKNLMREYFKIYNPNISPNFLILTEYSKKNILEIEKKVKYPLILKPANMSSSQMVTKCYHRQELDNVLRNIFKRGSFLQSLRADFFDWHKSEGMKVLAEEFMEGKMYSVDGLVDSQGKYIIYPPVQVKTGKEVGFDDFFGYQRMLPCQIKSEAVQEINEIVGKILDSLSLVSTHFHIELMRTEDGFKIIEIGPRLGGFREYMYEKVYDISIAKNDLLNKLGEKIILPKMEVKKYVSVLMFFAKQEGRIKKIIGFPKIEKLKSVDRIIKLKKAGDMAKFAKNGGKAVLRIELSNKDRGTLLGDVRQVEENLKIII